MIIMSADRTVAVNSNLVRRFNIFSIGNGRNVELIAVFSERDYVTIGEYPTIEAARAYLSRLVNILGDEYNGVEVVR